MSVPTMKDVAREAGVSLKTVSRYVNGETNIDPALAARIGAAITQLGYRRNLAAASIRPGQSSRVIGIVISDLANPYFSALTRAVESVARERGYILLSASSDDRGDVHDELVDRMLQQQVDGLILVPPRRAGRPWREVRPPVPPVVFVDRPPDVDGVDVILADNVGGARRATEVLAAHGARRVAFVGFDDETYTLRERYRGYVAALDSLGHSASEALVCSDSRESGRARQHVIDLLRDTDADAILAANNRAAVGALAAFSAGARRVPLIGFDDFEAATIVTPAVSVVSQDVAGMGRRAAELLLDRIAGAAPAPATRVFPTELVLRGSERPPA